MKLAKGLALAAVLLSVATVADAQRQRGGRGPGGGFGGPAALLGMPEVQAELKLDDAQKDLLRAVGEEMRSKSRELFQNFRDLSPEERERRMSAFGQEWEKKTGEILDEKQKTRLKQLSIQREGVRALGRKEIQDALKLTPEQRNKVTAAITGEREGMQAFFRGFQGGGNMTPDQRDEIRRKMTEMRTGTETKLNAVLTEPQKKQFQSMQGPAFKFPERQFGGRRQQQ